MKVQEFCLSENFSYVEPGTWDTNVIPQGTFVKPLNIYYVPKHIKDDPIHLFFDPTNEVFVYCSYGIIPIPKKYIREI
jgi:hypothetical protein